MTTPRARTFTLDNHTSSANMTDCRSAEHDTAPSAKEHVEEYLEVLRIFQEEGRELVKISWIAARLGIAKPSVVQMLKKMQGQNPQRLFNMEEAEAPDVPAAQPDRAADQPRVMEAFV